MHLFPGMTVVLLVLNVIKLQSAPLGTIQQARISTSGPSFWVYNQSSGSQCVCLSLQNPSIVAFNSFTLNQSCQLFSNLSAFPFQVISDSDVVVHLLQPLPPYTPCCSDLNWLLNQMKSNVVSQNIASVEGLTLDTDRNRLGVVSQTALQLISAGLITPMNLSTTPPFNARPISYYQGFFYVGIFPVTSPFAFHIYAASNLTKVGMMNFTQGSPQRIVWLFNDTLACILIQDGSSTSLAHFYNWPSMALNKSVSLGIANAYGLTKALNDDRFVYITDGLWGGNVWRLKTSPPYNFTQFASSTSNNESPANLVIDGCNRLWVAFTRYGIRIYDLNTTVMLGTWNMSSVAYNPALYDIVLTKQYQLYLADIARGTLSRYGSPLQCTN